MTKREWYGKPDYPLGKLQLELYIKGFDIFEERYHLGLVRKVEQMKTGGMIFVRGEEFKKIYALFDSMGIGGLEQMMIERQSFVKEFLELSEKFQPNLENIQHFIDVYPKMIMHFHIRWPYSVHVEKMLEQQMESIPPELHEIAFSYLAQIKGECEDVKSLKSYMNLMRMMKENKPGLLPRIIEHAERYMQVDRDDIRMHVPVDLAMYKLANEKHEPIIDDNVHEVDISPLCTSKIQTKEDPDLFRRTLYLAATQSRQKDDEHHLQHRGQWKIRKGLAEMGKRLVREGRFIVPEEIFEISCDELKMYASNEKF